MYEYANRLANLGYSVSITYPLITKYMSYRWSYPIRLLLSYIEGFKKDEWFQFNTNIERSYVKRVSDRYIKESDVIIATWWSTAFDMGQLDASKGKKINLIQGYENWEGQTDLVHASYDMPDVTNVVVASYLQEIVSKYTNKPITLIPNAIDNHKYYIKDPIESRKPETVCMMYSIQEIKGSKYGIEALHIVKDKYPDLTVELFGVCPTPENLPSWITFHRDPSDLCALYNRNAIFVANSFTEGMALTPMEAMFCGCASILTDIKGHSEYAREGETVLLYEVKNAIQLSAQIVRLIEDNQERLSIAKQGNTFIQQFSWDKAVDKMDVLIKQRIATK
jgi:glycosyltransferase involved in cell wall biosynthesis